MDKGGLDDFGLLGGGRGADGLVGAIVVRDGRFGRAIGVSSITVGAAVGRRLSGGGRCRRRDLHRFAGRLAGRGKHREVSSGSARPAVR